MILGVTYIVAFAISFLLTVAATRWLRDRAPRLGLIDRSEAARRLHGQPVAAVGGLALFLSIAITAVILSLATGVAHRLPVQFHELLPIALGATAMHAVGLLDDRRRLPARVKLLFQVVIAVAMFAAGVRIVSVLLPVAGLVTFSAAASLPLTVFWFVGITNAFNLVDGADGLAGGAALLATVSMFVVALSLGHQAAALFLVIVAAALLGFLHFNFPPATVFLGDSGSLFLGFLLAGLGLAGSVKAATVVAIAIPIVAFGLPVLDTALAIARRVLRGESVITGDRGHIHHRLLALGNSPRKVALILYAACGMFALGSMLLLSSNELVIGPAFVIMGIIIWFGIQRIRVPELLELRRLIDRGMGKRQVIAGNVAIREVCGQLGDAASSAELLELLRRALAQAPFEEAELRLSLEFAGRLAGIPGLSRRTSPHGEGYIWAWSRNGVCLSERESWVIKLPVLDSQARPVGSLTLRRRMNHDLPIELRVLSDELLPAFTRELPRLTHVPSTRGSVRTPSLVASSGP